MTRTRRCVTIALFAAVVLCVACTKKPSTDSAGDDDRPSPTGSDLDREEKEEAQKRLKQIGLAMQNYELAMGGQPLGIATQNGHLGLSWRVAILPYLEGDDAASLYHQFNLKEPWDSEHNKKLIARMPRVYESPGNKAPQGKTYLRSFEGESAFMRLPSVNVYVPEGKKRPGPFANYVPGTPARGRTLATISDGSSNTIAVAEAADSVEWTRPEELPYPGFPGAPKAPPVPKLGGPFAGGFHVLMGDGSAHFLPATFPEKALRAMITADGGEVLGPETTGILFPPDPKKAAIPKALPDDLPDVAARKTAIANYQTIVKAMYTHHDSLFHFPAGVSAGKSFGLSWRVQVLPYLGQDSLYREFKLDEPWDSEHNKKLIERMPKVFESPGKAVPKGHTFIRTTVGPGGIIRTGPDGRVQLRPAGQAVYGARITDIQDGTSLTILFVEAADAVPWTKPEELPFAIPAPVAGKGGVWGMPKDVKVPALGGVFADGFHAAMADGRITFYKTGYPSGELAKLLCPNDGWVVDPLQPADWIGYTIPMEPIPATTPPGKGGVPYVKPPK